MKPIPLALAGAWQLQAQPALDERGHFARLWDRAVLAEAGLPTRLEQMSSAVNMKAGTLRGLHFTWPPAAEGKYVRCVRGRVLDVLLDLRPRSPTYLQHQALELCATRPVTLFVPPGVAHGYQTLLDDTELYYAMDEAYRPDQLGTVRHDDPAFGIAWLLPVACIAARDRDAAPFDAAAHRRRWFAQEAHDAA